MGNHGWDRIDWDVMPRFLANFWESLGLVHGCRRPDPRMSLEIRHANELIRSCKGETWPKVLSALQMSLERGAEPTEFTSSFLVLLKMVCVFPMVTSLWFFPGS